MPRTIELTELERRKMAEAGRQSIACTNGWRPIETAPKDGTKVLLYIVSDDDADDLSFIDVGRWEILIDGEGRWDSIFEDGDEATHWQPLPKPPQEEI